MKNLTKHRIGIWGLGRTGKAAVQFLIPRAAQITVFDDRPLSDHDRNFLMEYGVQAIASLDEFFMHNDAILPSPGVNINPYRATYHGLWLNELDLFYEHFEKPIIAITGSFGKTTTTKLITQLLREAGWRVCAAGNIGTPMLEIIEQQNNLDAIVLEVSSFQLEHTQKFAPHLAIWTNFIPNHLDRHGTIEEYFAAKYQILAHQTATQRALVPRTLQEHIHAHHPSSSLSYFSTDHSAHTDVQYTIIEGNIVYKEPAKTKHLLALSSLPPLTFTANWLVAYSALDMLCVPVQPLYNSITLEHRLEKIDIINGISFYNDSKSTVPESTLAAIKSLAESRIMLFLGGLSKGIDRAPLIHALREKPIEIFCFGKEAHVLHELCKINQITAFACNTLEDAFTQCMSRTRTGDAILFSPAGSSYDLFTNYEERGNSFKKQVLIYKNAILNKGI